MAKKKAPKTPLLQPVLIPNLEPPFDGDPEGAHGGIGLRNTELKFVAYVINPKDGVDAGSVFRLYWGDRDTPVAITTIREEDKNETLIPFTVPKDQVREFWANPVFATLIRRGGNPTYSEEIKLRVRLKRPGGDPGPGPDHWGLQYELPPEVVLHGVSEEVALAGVKIIIRYWEYMRPHDLIILKWGSKSVERRVLPGEEGRDIVLTVDYETIKAAGTNRLTRVAYQVRDAGGNLPVEHARWSASRWLDVHLSEIRPEAPWLEFPNTYENRIDLSEVGSWPVVMGLWVTYAEASAYSHVTLMWDGRDSDNNPVPLPHPETQPLDRTGLYRFNIDNALVTAIAGGSAVVHALYHRGGAELPSQKLEVQVFGEVVRWPAPQIKEDLGGHLDPDFAATVYFAPQGSWLADGYIEVIFRFSSPENTIEHRVGRQVDDIPPTPDGNLEFIVYPDELQRFDGLIVDVFYAYTRPGGRPQESLRLEILVGTLERTMPAPHIENIIGGQLNPDDVGDYAKVNSTFTETLRADWIRMFWIGPNARTEVPVQVAVDGDTTVHEIGKNFLLSNLNESVTVFYTLTRGSGKPRYSNVTEVRISRDLLDLPPPTLLGADGTGPGTAELQPLNVQLGTKLVVSYVGMHDDDLITVTMAGAGNGGSPVIAPKPGNQALQKVEFDITSVAINANIRDHDTTVTFSYIVQRDGTSKPSKPLTVTVKPIPQPELAKTVFQINQVEHRTLDLNKFSGDATVRVGTWPTITRYYPVWLRILGKTASDGPHDILLFNGAGGAVVNQDWIDNGKLEWPVPRHYLNGLGHHTKLRMIFRAATSPSIDELHTITFPEVEYTVNTTQPPINFPVPILRRATGSGTAVTLAPMNAQNGATLSVEYLPMYTTDSIKVTMVGTAGLGSPVIPVKFGSTSGVVTFDIPKSAISANIGNGNKTFTLKYDVTRDGVARPSFLLTVTMTPIPQTDLPRALIDYVPNGASLNVARFDSATRWRLGSYPFQVPGAQLSWLTYTGTDKNNRAVTYEAWGAAVYNNAGPYEYNPSHDWFKALKHGSELTIEVRKAFDKVNNKIAAVTFPLTKYTVSNL